MFKNVDFFLKVNNDFFLLTKILANPIHHTQKISTSNLHRNIFKNQYNSILQV